jgi:hypothetical protein
MYKFLGISNLHFSISISFSFMSFYKADDTLDYADVIIEQTATKTSLTYPNDKRDTVLNILTLGSFIFRKSPPNTANLIFLTFENLIASS